MANDPDDLDLWKAYISDTSEEENSESDALWQNLTNKMDRLNTHRNGCFLKSAPKFKVTKNFQQKRVVKEAVEVPRVVTRGSPPLLGLDRSEKRRFHRQLAHHMLHIDLHGYTLKAAYSKLLQTFLMAQVQGVSLVRVVTGKGSITHTPDRPTLRQIFPVWMKEADFKSIVIKVRKAPVEHGGDGAFFVFIRRK